MESPAEQIVRGLRTWIVALLAMCGIFAGDIAADDLRLASGQSARVALRSVRFEPGDQNGAMSVVIEASGPLPEPASGTPLHPPPRIYLDFADVWPIRITEPVSNAVVWRVRAAENSATPLITRVVIDLTKATPYRIDSSARAQGRVVVVLGAGPSQPAQQPRPAPMPPARGSATSRSTATAPPPRKSSTANTSETSKPKPAAAPAPPPSASASKASAEATPPVRTPPSNPAMMPSAPATRPSAPVPNASAPATTPSAPPTQPAATPPRSTAAEAQYAARVSPVLLRLQSLRRVLEAIDRRTLPVPGGDMEATAMEFDDLGKLLSTFKAPFSRAATHALLLRACTLGARAARLREAPSGNPDDPLVWEAASAAAGALMMIDKANMDLSSK